MDVENIQQAINLAYQRLESLLQRSHQEEQQFRNLDDPISLLKEAMTELSMSLEETQVLAEELHLQNEELLATRHLVEAERQRYQDLFNFAPEGYLVTDTQGVILEANYAAAQMLNVRQSYLIGKPFSVFIHPKGRQNFRQLLVQLHEQKKLKEEEIYIYHLEGDIDFPAELNALAILDHQQKTETLRWLFRDISDRQKTQQKIAEQAVLLDITTDAILVLDLNNQILYWNKGAEHLYGWKAAETQGKNAHQLFGQKTPPQPKVIQKILMETGFWQGEIFKFTKDGQKVLVISRLILIYDSQNLPKSIMSVDTDITLTKELENQLLRSQRLESLGTLANGIAHDLNNILTPIMTIAQLLPMKHKYLDESSQQMLKMLETNAKRGADLVHQISSFTCGSENKRTLVQISHLIQDIKNIAQTTFSKSIEVSTNIATDIENVMGDTTQLHQVLLNLVINSRDAMPNGGKLHISASNLFIDETYAKTRIDAKVGLYILITVSDTGFGIHPEIMKRIFDPFFTTKEIGKGTGLGLSIVMGITKNHGGFVEVFSQVGIGSQFHIYLPSYTSLFTQVVNEVKLGTSQGELILVIDDELIITQITTTTLEMYNYKVLTAQNGIEAIALYNQHQEDIKLVLMDMMMPVMVGETAIRALQIINPQVKIIAMSGLATAEALTQITDNGIQGFLSKPFTAHELLKSVQNVLG